MLGRLAGEDDDPAVMTGARRLAARERRRVQCIRTRKASENDLNNPLPESRSLSTGWQLLTFLYRPV